MPNTIAGLKKLRELLFSDGSDSELVSVLGPSTDIASDERASSLVRAFHKSHPKCASRSETLIGGDLSIDPVGVIRRQCAGMPACCSFESMPLCRHTRRKGIVTVPVGRHSRLAVG